MFKRYVAIIMVIAMITASFIGCNGNDSSENSTNIIANNNTDVSGSGEINEEVKEISPEGYGILKDAVSGKIATLNPHRYMSTATEFPIISRLGARLYNYLPDEGFTTGYVGPEIAEGYPVQQDEDGMVWHIKVKEGLTWSNGDALTAEDVEYSIKMLLDPKLLNAKASNLLGGFISIQNAEQYYLQYGENGVATEWEEVGFKAIDETTLEVKTDVPHSELEVTLCFADGATILVYDEIFKNTISEDGSETLYGTSIENLAFSGPFTLEKWVIDGMVELKKNQNYVFADQIQLAGRETYIVDSSSTKMQLFEQGEIDYVRLSANDFEKYEQDPRVIEVGSKTVRDITFNTANPEKPILNNINFRNAIYYAIDREVLSNLVKELPANYYISTERFAKADEGLRYRDTEVGKALVTDDFGYNPDLAKEYFEKALEEEGLDKLELTLLYSQSANYGIMAEFLQSSLPNLLGEDKLSIELKSMPNTQIISHRKTWRDNPTAYEITFSGWGGSTLAPWNAMKYHTSSYKKRNEPWTDEEFDALWEEANFGESRLIEGKQIEYLGRMEEILFEQKPVVPLTQNVNRYIVSDRVQAGFPDYAPLIGFGWNYSTIND